jgi:uncharacterized protein
VTRFLFPVLPALALLVGGCDVQPAKAKPVLALTGRVVDAANIIDPAVEARLATLSADLETVTGNQFVIATTPSLDERTIENYSLDLARGWGIGRKEHDDGVMLLVAPNEKKVRIEVGYGLEQTLTNAEAGQIIRTDMLPAFRDGRIDAGVEQGSRAIVRELIRT